MIAPRVVHLVPALFGDRGILGGAERYAFELARHMAVTTPTRLVTYGDVDSTADIDGLQLRVLGNPWYVRGQQTNPIKAALIKELLWADVIHCHQQHVLSSSVAAVTGRTLGKKVFVSDLGGGGWDVSAYIPTDAWFHGHLHLSEYSRRVFGHAGRATARVISGGVDATKFIPRTDAGEPGDAVFVGRLLPHKGIDNLIQAAGFDIGITVFGRPYDEAFKIRLDHLARGRQITFVEGASDADIISAYQRALCVVLPSVYVDASGHRTNVPELLGQTLLEGMACGVPAVCTDVASMPEIVQDGINGLVVPPNDPLALRNALLWLRQNPAERRRMGQAARDTVLTRYAWRQVVERCFAAYAQAATP